MKMMMIPCNSLSSSPLPRLIPIAHRSPPPPPQKGHPIGPIFKVYRREPSRRGISVVTRAAPSSTSYIFAFVFPLSLLAITIFASARVADKLDQKFFEELAVNEAILEGEENGDEVAVSFEKEVAPIRSRNRPKREAEQN